MAGLNCSAFWKALLRAVLAPGSVIRIALTRPLATCSLECLQRSLLWTFAPLESSLQHSLGLLLGKLVRGVLHVPCFQNILILGVLLKCLFQSLGCALAPRRTLSRCRYCRCCLATLYLKDPTFQIQSPGLTLALNPKSLSPNLRLGRADVL